jgi:peptidoglycan-associated lipoprotein
MSIDNEAAVKRLLLVSLVLGLLVGCAALEPKPEEKSAPAAQPKAPPPPLAKPEKSPATKPAKQLPVKIDPFSDPKNLLSKTSIYYDFDSSNIKEEFKSIVRAHATYLADHPGARVRIEGNCDERGSREYNLALGQRRATSVRAMMELFGASGNQIDWVSFGEEKPRCTEPNEACWSQNRRSDIMYLKKE